MQSTYSFNKCVLKKQDNKNTELQGNSNRKVSYRMAKSKTQTNGSSFAQIADVYVEMK